MLDILANLNPIPCTRSTLKNMARAARDAYENAAEADKPQLAGMAIKISYFLEAIDRYCLSDILQGERGKRLDIKAPDFFVSTGKEEVLLSSE